MIDPQSIIRGLIQRGVPRNAAIALAGNMAVESGFDPGINEINPLVEGSRGGYGLIQWTGPRRRQLESFAGERASDVDTQLDFLVHELNTSERSARDAIFGAQNATDAARLVSERFLRPGIPHMDRRLAETQRLIGGPVERSEPQVQNVLAPAQPAQIPVPQSNPLNANDFMSRHRFTNFLGNPS